MYEFTLWLAYADVIDNKIEKIKQGLVEFQNKLYGTGNAIQSITKTLDKLFQRQDELFQRQDNIIKLLEVVYNNVENQALKIRPKVSGNIKHLSESRHDYLEYLLEKDDFIYTGFEGFDKWMGGIGRGWLYILAARPSVGKNCKGNTNGFRHCKKRCQRVGRLFDQGSN